MKITKFSDYSLRVLIYLSLHKNRCSIDDSQKAYGFSRNHLVKIVHHLSKNGFVASKRGKGGGLTLSRDPKKINLAEVIQITEPDLDVVECFNMDRNECCIAPICELKSVFFKARDAFLTVLKKYTLYDIIQNKAKLKKMLYQERAQT